MADTYTTNLNLTKPEPGAAEDTWGISLNADLDALDAIFSSSGTQINLNPNQINFADNKKAVFGAGSDLQIYHTSSDNSSYIRELGTGNLNILADHVKIMNAAATENKAFFVSDGGVYLYHNNSAKLETTSTGIDVTGNVSLADNGKAIFGAGSDLEIYSDGTHSYIEEKNASGNFYIKAESFNVGRQANSELYMTASPNGAVSLYHDNAVKLATTSTGIDVTGTITTDGLTTSADINFGDNDKAVFGAGSDLEIYHDGSTSYILDDGVGDLQLRSNNRIVIAKSPFEYMADFNADGAVDLYYDNSKKLATTSTGIDVTGTATMDGLTVDGNLAKNSNYNITQFYKADGSTRLAYMLFRDDGANYFEYNDTDTQSLIFQNDNKKVLSLGSNSDISFYNDTGTSQALYWDASAERLGIGTTSPARTAVINSSGTSTLQITNDTAGVTTTDGLQIKHFTSGATQIWNYENNYIAIGTNNTERARIDASGRLGIGTSSPSTALHVSAGDGSAELTVARTGTYASSWSLKPYNADFFIRESGTDRVTIKAGGNVGIGTTSPARELSIGDGTGSPNIQLLASTAGNSRIEFGDGDDSDVGEIQYVHSSNYMQFTTNGSEAARIDSSGRLGLGETGMSSYDGDADDLVIKTGGNTGITLRTSSTGTGSIYFADGTSGTERYQGTIRYRHNNNAMTFGTSAAEQMRLDSSGRLGLGTSSPDVALVISTDNSNPFTAGTNARQGAIAISSKNGSDLYGMFMGVDNNGRGWISAGRTNSATYYGLELNANGGTVNFGGNVAMGTSSPTAVANYKVLQVRGGSTSNGGLIRLETSDGTSGVARFYAGSGSTVLESTSNTPLAFGTNGTERARLDTSGNLLVGTTSSANTTDGVRITSGGYITIAQDAASVPTLFLNKITNDGQHIQFQKDGSEVGSIEVVTNTTSDISIGSDNVRLLFFTNGSAIVPRAASNASADNTIDLGNSGNRFKDLYLSGGHMNGQANALSFISGGNASNGGANILLYGQSHASLANTTIFRASGSESARLDASGNFMVGKTTIGVATTGSEIRADGQVSIVREGDTPLFVNRKTDDGNIADFRKDGTSVGSISVTSSATTYNTSSDARLKDVTGTAKGLEVINKLNPVAYNWKTDNKSDEGLIAQEVEEIVPNSVTKNDDGYYQMDYSKLVTPLIKAVQEQQEQIESLKSEIAKLKRE